MLVVGLALVWSVPAPAQEERGRVVLEDGRSFEGVVLHEDEGRIQLEVDGRRLTFKTGGIARYESIPPPSHPAEKAVDPAAGTGEHADTPADGPREAATAAAASPPGAGSAARPADGPAAGRADGPAARQAAPRKTPRAIRFSMLSRRIGVLEQRYPWIIPSGTVQWIGVGLVVLLYLTIAMQIGSWFAEAENRELPKALAAAIVTVIAAVVQLATVPFDVVTLPVLLVGNTVGWLVLTRILYGLGFFASCTMFFTALLVCGLAVVAFEVVDNILTGVPGAAG